MSAGHSGRVNRNWRQELETRHCEGSGGERSAIGNYAVTPEAFTYAPNGDGNGFLVMHMTVIVEDAGVMDSGRYGVNIDLTNGIRVVRRVTATEAETGDLMDFHRVRTNAQWTFYAEDLHLYDFGQGNSVYTTHFEFIAQWGVPWYIPNGQEVAVLLNDDFTGLIEHEFHLMGVPL